MRRERRSGDGGVDLARAGGLAEWEPDGRRAGWEALRAAGDSLPLATARHEMHNPRPLSETELIYEDYFATGMSITGHPMQHMRERLKKAGVVDSNGLKKLRGGEKILVAGLVTIRQRPASANGTIFLLFEAEGGFLNIVVPHCMGELSREAGRLAQFGVVRGRCGPVTRRQAPAQVTAGFEAERVPGPVLLLHVGRAPAVLEVVALLLAHVGIGDTAKVDPHVGKLVDEEGSRIQVADAVDLFPFIGAAPSLIA